MYSNELVAGKAIYKIGIDTAICERNMYIKCLFSILKLVKLFVDVLQSSINFNNMNCIISNKIYINIS